MSHNIFFGTNLNSGMISGCFGPKIFDNTNIRFGKRSLGSSSSFSGSSSIVAGFVTGIDLYHYAIEINGIIYHVQDRFETSFKIEITSSNYVRNSFRWFSANNGCHRSKSELESFSNDYMESKDYTLIPIGKGNINCQIFVRDMYCFAARISKLEAHSEMTLKVGLEIPLL
jgi:hypothetical protein